MQTTKNKIGIMQGRLSPAVDGKIQFFPWATWQQEFTLAKQNGFASIEFIFDFDQYEKNPLWTNEGIEELKKLIADTGVSLDHVCADYFMVRPFMRVSEADRQSSVEILKKLIIQAARVGVTGIEVPLVDNSRIHNNEEASVVVSSIQAVLPLAEQYKIEIGLETSLPPKNFKALLEQINHPLIKANYDTGNSSSLGYDTTEEIATFGQWISNIHIKDRVFGGTTVALGTGNANFEKTFQALAKINYAGPFILQAARAADGDEIRNAKHNLKFVQNLINAYLQ